MNPKSAEALVGASVISMILGHFVLDPSAGLFLYGVAALSAAIPAIFGAKVPRVAGAFALIFSLALMVAKYPEHSERMERMRERKMAIQKGASSPPLPRQQESRQGSDSANPTADTDARKSNVRGSP